VDDFESPNRGATYVLESWPGLVSRTLARLRPRFRKDEAIVILDAMRQVGYPLEPAYATAAGRAVCLHVEEAMDDGQQHHLEDDAAEALLDKLAALSPFEAHTIEVWSARYWSEYHRPCANNMLANILAELAGSPS
jgi:hypothetical protein